ncbi:beta-lactamase/transpeptidase-like protein [Aspergillus multicolor]|uniref:serine hydrolase domain-containing protein n=1 Tax=Aspergillus multicolor TaxID=41759 RepID=UPI003CCD0F83
MCQTPSITFGAVHQGEVIFKQSIGHRDANPESPTPDADTMFMIGSCSKIPEGDPRIGKEADIIDCLRHSTGLTAPAMLMFGPHGTILTDEDDLVHLLNVMPTVDKDGNQRFNRDWNYNNGPVGLVALIIQKVTGQRFAEFVRERILEPLGMSRTAMRRSDLESEDIVAAPCL